MKVSDAAVKSTLQTWPLLKDDHPAFVPDCETA